MDIEPVSHRLGQAPHGCKIISMLRRSLHESIKEALPFLAITHPFLAFYTNLLDTYWPVTYQEVRWGPLVLWWVRLCEVVMWPPLCLTQESTHTTLFRVQSARPLLPPPAPPLATTNPHTLLLLLLVSLVSLWGGDWLVYQARSLPLPP